MGRRPPASLKEGEVVLLQTSWDRYYVEGEEGLKYMHGSLVTMDAPGWPAPAPEMILYLHEKGVKTVGIDAPSSGALTTRSPCTRRA